MKTCLLLLQSRGQGLYDGYINMKHVDHLLLYSWIALNWMNQVNYVPQLPFSFLHKLLYLSPSIHMGKYWLFVYVSPYSGRRWAVMMKTWIPSGLTKSAMFSTTIRTTGYGQSTSGVAVRSGSMLRWNSQWGTAAASLMCQAPVKRRLTFITMNQILTQPPETHRLGWRTPGSRSTLLQLTRASPRWT